METQLNNTTAAALNVLANDEYERAAAEQAAADAKKPPVLMLGYEGEAMVLYSRRYPRMLRLMPNQLKRDYLLQLAPLKSWVSWLYPEKKPKGKRESEIFKDAQARLIELTGCRRFDPKKIRKLGMWKTKEGIFYNAGDACFILPEGSAPGSLPVKIEPCRPDGTIFETGDTLPHFAGDALTDSEAHLVKAYIAACNWVEPYAAELLAGWIPCAVLGGILEYRPHIWMNAERGCGKTTLMLMIAHILGGDLNAAADGGLAVMLASAKTSDSAFRREMGNTTRPGIFDESEVKSENERAHIDAILAYIRLSIDGLASKICGKNNVVERYSMRSCFLLASIRNSLFQASDESRFVVLNMRKEKNKDALARMLARQNELRLQFPADITGRLIARCLKFAPQMLANAAQISDTLLRCGVEGRTSDKLGHLLAGAWLMENTAAVTPRYLERCKVIAAAVSRNEQMECDGGRCLRVMLDKTSPARRRPIGELARCVAVCDSNEEARNELARYGFSVITYSGKKYPNAEGKRFLRAYIGNANFKTLFDDTDWQGGKVKQTLLQLDGVLENTARPITGGNPEACLLIPACYWGTDPTADDTEGE